MGVMIKGLEMPNDCMECMFCNHIKSNDYGTYGDCAILGDKERMNLLLHQKHSGCPLVETEESQDTMLEKIRAEIMQLDYDTESVDYDYNDMVQTEEVHTIYREEVLQIIDKYKKEGEQK